jgi:hypothetical protein
MLVSLDCPPATTPGLQGSVVQGTNQPVATESGRAELIPWQFLEVSNLTLRQIDLDTPKPLVFVLSARDYQHVS